MIDFLSYPILIIDQNYIYGFFSNFKKIIILLFIFDLDKIKKFKKKFKKKLFLVIKTLNFR